MEKFGIGTCIFENLVLEKYCISWFIVFGWLKRVGARGQEVPFLFWSQLLHQLLPTLLRRESFLLSNSWGLLFRWSPRAITNIVWSPQLRKLLLLHFEFTAATTPWKTPDPSSLHTSWWIPYGITLWLLKAWNRFYRYNFRQSENLLP